MKKISRKQFPHVLRGIQLPYEMYLITDHQDVENIPDEAGVLIIHNCGSDEFDISVTRRLKLWVRTGIYNFISKRKWPIHNVDIYFIPTLRSELSDVRYEIKLEIQYLHGFIGTIRTGHKTCIQRDYEDKTQHRKIPVKTPQGNFSSITEASAYIPKPIKAIRNKLLEKRD